MKRILDKLLNNSAVQVLLNEKGTLGNLNPMEEALLLATTYSVKKNKMLVVKSNQYTAQRLAERLIPLTSARVLVFAVEESLRVEAISSSPEMKASQLETMNAMLEDEVDIVITHTGALVRYLPEINQFKKCCVHLKTNEEISLDELKERLFYAGYELVSRVDTPLTYASRGGIVDVFSINHEYPIRIEFFDNEIESIRYFDCTTQRTIEVIEEVKIIPATDLLFSDEDIATIIEKGNERLEKTKNNYTNTAQENYISTINEDFDGLLNHTKENHYYRYFTLCEHETTLKDYFDATIYLSNVDEVKAKYKSIQEETIIYLQELVSLGKALPMYTHFTSLDHATKGHEVIEFQSFVDARTHIMSGFNGIDMANMPLENKLLLIIEQAKNNSVILCANETETNVLVHAFNTLNKNVNLLTENDRITQGIHILNHEITEGFSCAYEQIIVYSSKELFNIKKVPGKFINKFNKAESLTTFEQLHKGDYVVHEKYGVGLYNGIITREVNGLHKDYLQIIYKGDDQLLVPLEQFQLVRKFMSKEGATPKLHKIGANEWQKTKQKISQNVQELAQRLVALYSLREENIGFAYSKDTKDHEEFEKVFEYELTRDQRKAINEIKQDMESSKPMDRLLCGDVGFGKTEVAILAAYKAVYDQKQVAYLCPTTILSQQHFKVFRHRFRYEGVNVAVLNRFVPVSDQKKILQDLKDGKIDILIGTHRILSKDIVFKDLGLLIIDEEQRFGVQHKERIKEMKSSIDVLSLSATPIPRTLQMSLIGVRGLSQLETPPRNRQSVQTYVLEKNPNMIKEVIERELARDGQVFYLYNNVKDIYEVANKLRKQLDVEVGVAHGKMDRETIEDVMLKFINNEFKVLVCTTIIETGIDIPNANTIIIEDADKFGLAQLYQIKGRVGRSERMAYAYLLYQKNKQMNEDATKRLKAIKEFAQLGSGYKIAMRDLSIRGSGDILGGEQAGFIDTVGFDMYMKILQEAIDEKTGVKSENKEIPVHNIQVEGYIPENYVENDIEKLNLYQKVYHAQHMNQMISLEKELKDLYGTLPREVNNIVLKRKYEILCTESFIDEVKESDNKVHIMLTPEFSNEIPGDKLFELVNRLFKKPLFKYMKNEIVIIFEMEGQWLPLAIELLNELKKMSEG